MLSDILPLPEVELCDAEHRPPVAFPKQRADVPRSKLVSACWLLDSMSRRFHFAAACKRDLGVRQAFSAAHQVAMTAVDSARSSLSPHP